MKKQKRKERKNGIRISTNMFPLFLSNAERKLDETNCPNTSKKENCNEINSKLKTIQTIQQRRVCRRKNKLGVMKKMEANGEATKPTNQSRSTTHN